MGLVIDWYAQRILVTSPTTEVSMQTLHDFIEDEMASPVGLQHGDILQPEGKIEDPSNPGIFSQIIVVLHSPWQVQFWGGSGYSRIYGGKLVGGLADEPIKATGTAGDITVLESPVDGVTVTIGSGLSSDEHDMLEDMADFSGHRSGFPMTVTPSGKTVNGKVLTYTGDGITSTVVERTT